MLTQGEAQSIKDWLDMALVQVESTEESADEGTNLLGRLFPFARDSKSRSLQDLAASSRALYNAYQGVFMRLLTSQDDEHEEAINLLSAIKALKNSGDSQTAEDLKRAIDLGDTGQGGGGASLAKAATDNVFDPISKLLRTMAIYAALIGVGVLAFIYSPEIKGIVKVGKRKGRK